jgi:DNA-binding transcriptional LysR family regulator
MTHALPVLDWNDLKFFLAIARSGSIRAGAHSLRANHVTVSRRLAQLETAIDARLFDRTHRGLILTQLGEELLPNAERVEA